MEQTTVNNLSAIPRLLSNHRIANTTHMQRGIVSSNLVPIKLSSVNSSKMVYCSSSAASGATLDTPSDMNSCSNGIGIIHLNARSLIQKLDFIEILVSQSNVDVLVVSESWLCDSVPDSDVQLIGYNIYRADRVGRGGGIAIYVKCCLNVSVSISTSVPKQYECLVLNLVLGNNARLTLGGVYRPPSAPPCTLCKLSDILSNYANSELLILGDFNLDWLSPVSDKLKDICTELNLTQLITKPTRPNFKNPVKSTLLDIILTNTPHKYTASGVFANDISDHCPIACIRDTRLKHSDPCIISKRNYKHFSQQAFTLDLYHSEFLSTCCFLDPVLALAFFSSIVTSMSDKHAPLKNHRVRNRTSSWFSPELSGLFLQKNRAWALARKTGTPADWLFFRQLRNKCTAAVKKAKSNYFLNAMTDSAGDPAKFWKTVNSLKRGNSAVSLPKQITSDSCILSEKNDICDAFNKHFISAGFLFERKSGHCGTGQLVDFSSCFSTVTLKNGNPVFSFQKITEAEVLAALCAIDTKKSLGADNLDPFLLKCAAPIIAGSVTHIFNLTLSTGIIPKVWKAAFVLPLHKGGDGSDLDNYRPISRLPCLAKILESIVNKQLQSFLSANSILSTNQSGFRSKHSTTSATMLVVNDIANALDDRKHCAALFVDLSKAFDTVDHAILLSKLSSIGVGTDACRWFYDYLKDRTQAVMVDGVKSDSLQLLKGVPQGSIIGPLLFSLYINNIGDDVRYCKFHLYADDTVMYSIAPTADQALMQLESDFRILQGSLLQLKLVLNAKKTNVMFFSRSKLSVRNTFVITSLDGTQIKQVSAYKYLGVWLDDRLSFKKHVTELGKKLKFKIGFLYRNRACLSSVNRKQIVQATFMSVLDYGDIIYMHASANTLKPLDAIYHCALRFITGDSYKTHHCILYQHVGWASLSVRREQHALLFIYKALLLKLPPYISSLISTRYTNFKTRSQMWITLETPAVSTELGRTAFSSFAPYLWNKLQIQLKLDTLVSLAHFKNVMEDQYDVVCDCFC